MREERKEGRSEGKDEENGFFTTHVPKSSLPLAVIAPNNAPFHDKTGVLSSDTSSTRQRLSWLKCPSQSSLNTASSFC